MLELRFDSEPASYGAVAWPCAITLSVGRIAMSFLILGLCVVAFGCKGSDTTWSDEARSPDGKMIAVARTVVSGGFGTDGYSSTVSLNWTTGSQDPVNILVFTDAPPEPANTPVVSMKWLSPTRLELTYKGRRTIGFQAVKCDGIDISLQNLSSGTIDGSQ